MAVIIYIGLGVFFIMGMGFALLIGDLFMPFTPNLDRLNRELEISIKNLSDAIDKANKILSRNTHNIPITEQNGTK